MPLGTKWKIVFETTDPLGERFVEGAIIDTIGTDDEDNPIVKKIKVDCLKELTDEEYKAHDEMMEKMQDGG